MPISSLSIRRARATAPRSRRRAYPTSSLIPVRPKIFDLETLASIRDLLRVAGDPVAYVLLNGLHQAARQAADQAKELTASSFGIKVCPVHLCQRDIYADAPETGKSAQEIDPSGKAAEEMRQLYVFISQHVRLLEGKQNGKEHGELAASA